MNLRGLRLIWLLLTPSILTARNYTEHEGRVAWAALRQQPIGENTFHQVCDLVQDIGQTNLPLSYEILGNYLPMVRATGNRQWVHVLLMSWAKAKESLTAFPEAETLYRQARENAPSGTRLEREALVGTVLLYLEWGRPDSLDAYLAKAETACVQGHDPENLSFVYTFKAMGHPQDTASMSTDLQKAITLASGIEDKNALFTARYNYAVSACAHNPQAQVTQLDACLELCRDSTLSHKPRLYQRTAFYFRNPAPSVFFQLMQVNLLLADYSNAGKYADTFYAATVKARPGNPQTPYFDAEMAIVKVYQGDIPAARAFLKESLALFGTVENSVTYVSYFIGAGLLAEHDGQIARAERYYASAARTGNNEGLHVVPTGMYYAHCLILEGNLLKAREVLAGFLPQLPVREYSAYGYFYYRNYADLLKASGDLKGYASALDTYYTIGDSLGNLNRYRAVEEVETKMRVRDKETQITLLDQENAERLQRLHRDRIYFIVLSCLAAAILLLLVGYARNLGRRKRQTEQIARQKEILQQHQLRQVEKQHRIDVMERVLEAEQGERRKIADQLHDEVGSELSLASLNLSSVLEEERPIGSGEEKLLQAKKMLATVSTTIRDLSHRLTPMVIEQYGFRKAVEDLAYSINLSGKLQLETVIVGLTDPDPYPIAVLNDLYRVIQELLHNVLKHARATHALLELVEHEHDLSLLVEDNGVGIPAGRAAPTSTGGRGLATIRSRIEYLGGRMEISTKKEGGTMIMIEIHTKQA